MQGHQSQQEVRCVTDEEWFYFNNGFIMVFIFYSKTLLKVHWGKVKSFMLNLQYFNQWYKEEEEKEIEEARNTLSGDPG